MTPIRLGNRTLGPGAPSYIICEVGSNFDHDLERAKALATRAKALGADAYKIQNFLAPKIVSNVGFEGLKISFQSTWEKPVVEVYRDAEFPREWLKDVADHCRDIGIDFLSAPYDTDAVDALEAIGVTAYKIGSGEIDHLEFLTYVAKKGKPVLIACGAATVDETARAVETIKAAGNDQIVLMQCTTNYPSPLKDSNVRAMTTLGEMFQVLVGYSDHTVGPEGSGDDPLGGLSVPLAAVALGACVIEKHFTDDRARKGPDHPFAMDPEGFGRMVDGIRAVEAAMGDGQKRVMPCEQETAIIQRRGVYAVRDIAEGERLERDQFVCLRPAVGLRPPQLSQMVGKTARRALRAGQPIMADDVVSLAESPVVDTA